MRRPTWRRPTRGATAVTPAAQPLAGPGGLVLPAPTSARPGPGPIPDAVVAGIDLRVGRRIGGRRAGDHPAAAIGRGIELDRIRAYEPGDDVRTIDWNVTARTGQAHVRQHVPERQLTTWLVLDRSASMHFGTALRRKADVADGVALVVGRLATRRADRLGVVTTGGPAAAIHPPRSGRRGLQAITAAVAAGTAEEGDPGGSLARGLVTVARSRTQRGLAVVVSDLRGARDWEPALAELAARHAVLIVEIVDPREETLVDVGELYLVDPESGRRLRVETADRRLRERYATAAREERDDIGRSIARLGVRHVRLRTDRPWLADLSSALERGAGHDAAAAERRAAMGGAA